MTDKVKIIEDLREKILAFNTQKNSYASNKIKGEDMEKAKKDIISSLIYLIADMRKVGEDTETLDISIPENNQYIEKLKLLNENIKNLKTQTLFLVESSVETIKKEIESQKDKDYIETKKIKKEEKNNLGSSIERETSIRNRLRKKLQDNEEDNKE